MPAATCQHSGPTLCSFNDYGILPEQNLVQPGYWFANVSQAISVTYAVSIR